MENCPITLRKGVWANGGIDPHMLIFSTSFMPLLSWTSGHFAPKETSDTPRKGAWVGPRMLPWKCVPNLNDKTEDRLRKPQKHCQK
jgi:hypothetical protein